jgi:hypothetical protein
MLSVATHALAQLHWDVAAEAGATKRFTSGGSADPEIGPGAQLQAHAALVPLVRIGVYGAFDASPVSGFPTRHFVGGGLHAKFSPPLLGSHWRTWLYVGAGYAYTYATGVSGGIIDVPVGLGLGYRLGPIVPFVELGTRFGLGFWGSMYDPNDTTYLGHDSVAVSLSVGVILEQ